MTFEFMTDVFRAQPWFILTAILGGVGIGGIVIGLAGAAIEEAPEFLFVSLFGAVLSLVMFMIAVDGSSDSRDELNAMFLEHGVIAVDEIEEPGIQFAATKDGKVMLCSITDLGKKNVYSVTCK